MGKDTPSMLNRLFGKLSGESKKKGFTLTELLVVIAIIAVVCAIAIPSIISINKSLKFKQANEYAESIFMAVQANLTEMRSDGRLSELLVEDNGAEEIPDNADGFPTDEIHRNQYRYATSEDAVYDVLLPKTSIDSDARDGNVLIEYNPHTGNVYSVFYKASGDELTYDTISRDEDERRDMCLGYYCGSALSTTPLTPEETTAQIDYENGEEFIAKVIVPIPESYKNNINTFANGLEVYLTVTGEGKNLNRSGSGSFTVLMKKQNDPGSYKINDGKVEISYTLDSLADTSSFANLGDNDDTVSTSSSAKFASVVAASLTNETETSKQSLTSITSGHTFNIYPGENVELSAQITFTPSANKGSVNIHAETLSNVNPMFDSLVQSASESSKYVITLKNGRNLQNLNAVASEIAKNVKTVSFASDIDWNTTVTYYNSKYASGGTYKNDTAESPARALPYFVPIHNDNLFGTAQFVYPKDSNGLWQKIKNWLSDMSGIDIYQDSDVPTLTDELDTDTVHATVSGNGHKVLNININAQAGYSLTGSYYALSTKSSNNDVFTGLFGYVNTTIDSLSVVNPIVVGGAFVGNNNPGTGALVGAAGYNTLLTNCSTYIDTTAETYNQSKLYSGAVKQAAYDVADGCYGVKGSGAVGGLVGYSKSHRTVSGELTNDTSTLAFSNCFAAVPVSGHMRDTAGTGTTAKHYGYTNGVGGLVGNAEISNFYNCYASGDVIADNVYVSNNWSVGGAITSLAEKFSSWLGTTNVVDLLYNGRTSWGAGGFVGTSHGVRYTNCFASGDVIGTSSSSSSVSSKGTGGFVGIMSYEETRAYGNDKYNNNNISVAQRTVFQNCYAVGLAKVKNGDAAVNAENFSGANARIKNDGFSGTLKYWTGNYYVSYAPWWYDQTPNTDGSIQRLPYESFIFKDSYYISQYVVTKSDKDTKGATIQSNSCAAPVSYTQLKNLTGMQTDSTWITGQIKSIKTRYVSGTIDAIIKAFKGKDVDDTTTYNANPFNFGGVYFGDWVNQNVDGTPRYVHKVWKYGPLARLILDQSNRIAKNGEEPEWYEGLDNDKYKAYYKTYYANDLSSLADIYENLYKEGFSKGWEAGGSEKTTHSYDLTSTQNAYPFSKLTGLDYYGRWPSRILACGLAYYEQYADGTYGYYFDRDATSTLRDEQVVSDGYAILTSAADDNISVTVNGVEVPTIYEGQYTATYTSDTSVYYVHRLSADALKNISSDGYYTEVKATVNGEKYTMYFNPNVAISQLNPVDDGVEGSTAKYNAVKLNAPKNNTVYIRSARQLANLGSNSMSAYVRNDSFKFVQQVNIDASAYTASSYAEANRSAIVSAAKNNTSIASFSASYSGSEKTVSGFSSPIFSVIDEPGTVSDLVVSCSAAFGNNNTETVGLLAVENKGTVDNVDARIEGTASVTAKTTAGLLIGINSGTLKNCDLTAPAGASVKAGENSGGFVGINSGTIANCTANIGGELKLEATNAGGFVGAASNGSKINNVSITAANITGDDSVGAFAGSMNTAGADTVTVTVNGTVSANENAAGFAANVSSGTIKNITINVVPVSAEETESTSTAGIRAKTASGIIGTADSASLSDITLNLSGSITGADAAVGAISSITGGTTKNIKVALNGGTISAANNAAGFTLESKYLVDKCDVCGTGSITATAADGNAAGFAITVAQSSDPNAQVSNCYISPVDRSSASLAEAYKASDLSKLTISGNSAAGFAVHVSGVVNNSTALGTISGTAVSAGFVANVNGGAITGCMANADVGENGYAFTASNSGMVSNCYAWYLNGSADHTAKDADGNTHYYACYFAPLSPKEGVAEPVTVVKGSADAVKMSYDGLASLTPEELCPEDSRNIWSLAGKNESYPFSDLRPASYAYPTLRSHYGDWVNPTGYSYGIVYYERYANTSMGMKLVDVSYIAEGTTRQHYSLNNLDSSDSKTITETGYALFYHNPNQIVIEGTDDIETKYTSLDVKTDNLNGLKCGTSSADDVQFLKDYKFAIIPDTQNAASTQVVTIIGLDNVKSLVVPAFANAIYPNWTDEQSTTARTYEIRTAEQFNNMTKELILSKIKDCGTPSAAEGFTQTHSFSFTEKTKPSITSFKNLSYNGSDKSITVDGTLSGGIFGDLVKASVQNLTIKNANLTVNAPEKTDSDEEVSKLAVGALANSVDKDSTVTIASLVDPKITVSVTDYDNTQFIIGALVGENFGTIDKASVTVTAQKDENDTVKTDADGKTIYNSFDIDASGTTLSDKALKLCIGGLVGSNGDDGKVTESSVTADIDYTPVCIAKDDDGKAEGYTDDKASLELKLGSLVGDNSGTIKAPTITGDISIGEIKTPENFTVTNTVKLGGIVGNVSGGTISGTADKTAVSGKISVAGNTTNVYVGGAVGYADGNASYSNVTANVEISGGWTNGNITTANYDSPSGYANVGKFVGYVKNGTFTYCSGTGDGEFHFLGSIEKQSGTCGANWYVAKAQLTGELANVKTYTSGSYDVNGTAVIKNTSTSNYSSFSAQLNNCTYTSGTEMKKQEITTDAWFYTLSGQSTFEEYTIKQTNSITDGEKYLIVGEVNSVKYAMYENGGTETDLGSLSSVVITPILNSSFNNEDTSSSYYKSIWTISNNQKYFMSVLGHYLSRPDATGDNRQYSLVKTIKDIENEPVGSFSGNNYSISSYISGFLGFGKGYVNLKIGQNQMIGTGKVDNKEYNLLAYSVTTTSYYRGTFTYANCNQSIK
jgi:prepilin-type N-terminal cleavage/methylation domain-containing protein